MTQPSPKRAEILQCPHCNNDVGVTLDLAACQMPCPHCGQAMVIPAVDGSIELPESDPFALEYEAAGDAQDEEERFRREAEGRLNSLRIQAITAEHRALNRSRSFATAGGVAMLIVIAHCLIEIGSNVAAGGWGLSSTALAGVTLAAAIVAVWLFRRARRLAALARRRRLLDDPDTPPDFTPLQDGSQRWRNLEQVEE